MIDKRSNLFDECAAIFVHLSPQEEEWNCMYTSGSMANSQRMLTEIYKSGAVAKIRTKVESDTAKLKDFQNNFYQNENFVS